MLLHLHHLTLSDMAIARELLGEKAIIGVTISTIDEARNACKDGADYLGIGTMFATPTWETRVLPEMVGD